ncbi:hypothetical protein BV22DRAFT_1130768 [Leucogyrophana mollusca]|uniref:Uncharacterized protein n=1 Tax=Leucogyrophana mollusca TaxID=85980 RepID=A0ACB8BCV8_9AGAM|nr:hypothetical protein BV22DRAFT_1130768 [Leucogyrophana mollusca]
MRFESLATIIIAAAATLELVGATCKTHTPSGAGKWQMDFFSEPNCAGEHRPLHGTQEDRTHGAPGTTCTCHNLGYFDCDLVQSFVFSPAKMSWDDRLGVVLWEKKDCKGDHLGSHYGGAWSVTHANKDQRRVNAFQTCVDSLI